MNCPKCNTPTPDGQKFCGNCGAELPTDGTVKKENNNSFNYADNASSQSGKPKKKKHGCLIAVLVVVGLFVLLIIFGMISGSNDSSDSKKDNSNSKTEASETKKKEYVDDINAVANSPKKYKGKYIKFYGVVSNIDSDDDRYGYQVYIDQDHNTSVLLEVPKSILKDTINPDDYISVDAKLMAHMTVKQSWELIQHGLIWKQNQLKKQHIQNRLGRPVQLGNLPIKR